MIAPRPALSLAVAGALGLSACASMPDRAPRIDAARGQTDEQLDRDRYECALVAQRQVGTDPPGSLLRGMLIGGLMGGAIGAGLGASAGALVASAADGAIIGTGTGGGLGGAIGSNVALARDVDARERALYACLTARGYVVREWPEAR
jgi:hypothetical protein